MNQHLQNLKPTSLHTHTDKAQKLGVPRANVLDLRALAEERQQEVALNETGLSKANLSKAETTQNTEQKKPSWLERRRLAKQAAQQLELQAIEAEAQQVARRHSITVQQSGVKQCQTEDQTSDTTIAEHVAHTIDADHETIQETITESIIEPVAAPIPEAARIQASTDNTLDNTSKKDDSIERAAIRLERRKAKQQAKESARAEKLTRKQNYRVAKQWQLAIKPTLAFVVVCLVLVSPFASTAVFTHVNGMRDEVISVSEEAVNNLSDGTRSASELDFASASQAFTQASTNFKEAHDQLVFVNTALEPVIKVVPEVGKQYSSAENVLVAGEHISEAAQDVANAFTVLTNLDAPTIAANGDSDLAITDVLVIAHSALRPAAPRLELAALALAEVDPNSFPEEYRSSLRLAQETIPTIASSMKQLLALNETMLTILGHDSSKRYLVLFQNNRELRATGGFIGSFAVIDINKGKVSNIEIPGGGTYDLQGGLSTKVLAPQPLRLVNPHWQTQDANWWPDFPTSAQKVQWFYKKSGGSSVDGVITLTPDVVEQMLAVTGPIDMPEYAGTLSDTTLSESDTESEVIVEPVVETVGEFALDENYSITAENFYRVTQAQAERKYDDTNQSKQFIADLTPKLFEQLFSETDNLLPVLQIFYNSLSEKNVLVYFNDPFLQDEMKALGWTGEVKSTGKDYLQVVDTNIAGGKTDGVIDNTIELHTTIERDGSIIDEVTITRVHNGTSDDEFEDAVNMDYMRVYVPEGSELLSVENESEQPDPKLFLNPDAGYEPDEDLAAISGDTIIDEATGVRKNTEFGKTVFGVWVGTQPGETSKVTLRYGLPQAMNLNIGGVLHPADNYSLLIQKQPGSFDPLVKTSITYPENYHISWSYPEQSEGVIHQSLTKDAYVGVVFQQ